jgi:AraC-like DNA-binding protein
MMKNDELQYNILYSCTDERKRGGEQLVQEHVLSCVISGEIQFHNNQNLYRYGTGSVGLIRRNVLLKSIKVPSPDGRPFQSLNIFLDQQSLKKYNNHENLAATGVYTDEPIIEMSSDPFLKGYFDSVLPYFKSDVPLSMGMAELKTKEAIELVLRHNPRLKNLLFDFAEPFKIDLEAYMSQNYIYNISMSQFARLTGRSLATFKRDFKKTFENSPEKWLLQKRLERAHFLIAQQQQNPVDVYLDVGFESLSHFSSSFKKFFGYNPSSLTFGN